MPEPSGALSEAFQSTMLWKLRSRCLRLAALACIAAATLPAQAFDLQAHRGGRGPPISRLSLAQVQSFDVGRINPADTLAPEAFVETLLAVIRQAGMTQRVMIQSFDWRTLELLHTLEPGLRTMYLSSESSGFNTVKDGSWTAGHLLKDHGGSVPRLVRASAGKAAGVIWAPNFNNLSAALVKEAQALGLQIIPWTVNQKAQMERPIEWGVDGLITDYPDRLREVMGQRGMPVPRGVH